MKQFLGRVAYSLLGITDYSGEWPSYKASHNAEIQERGAHPIFGFADSLGIFDNKDEEVVVLELETSEEEGDALFYIVASTEDIERLVSAEGMDHIGIYSIPKPNAAKLINAVATKYGEMGVPNAEFLLASGEALRL